MTGDLKRLAGETAEVRRLAAEAAQAMLSALERLAAALKELGDRMESLLEDPEEFLATHEGQAFLDRALWRVRLCSAGSTEGAACAEARGEP
jgi:hypothetical protein